MIDVVHEKQDQVGRLCERFGVKRFEVFGSAVLPNSFAADSDLDFLVEFLPTTPIGHADAYFGLLNALRELFERPVDLLETKAIKNPYLWESINQQRVELYAACRQEVGFIPKVEDTTDICSISKNR